MSVTCGQNDNYTDVYDSKMANCCQNVRDNKTNKDQNDNKNKQTNKTRNKTKQNNNKMGGGDVVERANN